MPIYEYQCQHCNYSCDLLQKINADPIKLCPKCNKETLVKLVSATTFQLKGTGWYATDFKNSGSNNKSTTTTDTTKGEAN